MTKIFTSLTHRQRRGQAGRSRWPRKATTAETHGVYADRKRQFGHCAILLNCRSGAMAAECRPNLAEKGRHRSNPGQISEHVDQTRPIWFGIEQNQPEFDRVGAEDGHFRPHSARDHTHPNSAEVDQECVELAGMLAQKRPKLERFRPSVARKRPKSATLDQNWPGTESDRNLARCRSKLCHPETRNDDDVGAMIEQRRVIAQQRSRVKFCVNRSMFSGPDLPRSPEFVQIRARAGRNWTDSGRIRAEIVRMFVARVRPHLGRFGPIAANSAETGPTWAKLGRHWPEFSPESAEDGSMLTPQWHRTRSRPMCGKCPRSRPTIRPTWIELDQRTHCAVATTAAEYNPERRAYCAPLGRSPTMQS